MMTTIDYNQRVLDYLNELGVKVTITPSIRQTCPDRCESHVWQDFRTKFKKRLHHNHGWQYTIRLERQGKQTLELTNWWNSINSRWTFRPSVNELFENQPTSSLSKPTAYDMLSGYSSEFFTNRETFESFCSNFGYDTDSIKANNIYMECLKDAILFQQMFTDEELEKLAEIAA